LGAEKGNAMAKHLSAYPTSRRSLLAGAGVLLAGGVMTAPAWAQATAKSGAAKSPHQAIAEVTKRCETMGKACLKHCQRLTRLGDKSIADCMRSVSVMLPVCVATNRLAQQDAKRLQDLAKVCADICRDCEAECRKHEFHHVECKRCAEACAETVKALATL
jgi:Cys-rich four helix bundle protein (predicted Tat secretion target)